MQDNKDHEGSMGTDRVPPSGTDNVVPDENMTEQERREAELKKRIEELRKRDPFIYK